MSEPSVYLIRHGDTEWSENGRHTGSTDIPLLPEGEDRARSLAPVLAEHRFARVLSSPLQRARRTAELAGFGDRVEVTPDLVEWDYGDYEGLTSPEILEKDPYWSLWAVGAPNGETPEQIGERVDRVIADALTADGDVLMFAHGHILRVLGARWINAPVAFGGLIKLSPATISELGYEHGYRAIERWNAPAI